VAEGGHAADSKNVWLKPASPVIWVIGCTVRVDDEVVAVAHGAGLQRREVRGVARR